VQYEQAEAVGMDTQEPAPQGEAADARQQVSVLKRKLEEAAAEAGRMQASLASQQQLEHLLKQGRTHLQDMRLRLEQVSAERDRLQTELSDHAVARQREVAELQAQIDDIRKQLHNVSTERDGLATQLEEREAAHERSEEERAGEHATFERLLAEAKSSQTQMLQEIGEHRQQVDSLRGAANRAQSFAREIIRAHEGAPPPDSTD
jgi:chromosome segregation ATPase